jgi:hypothetical protein
MEKETNKIKQYFHKLMQTVSVFERKIKNFNKNFDDTNTTVVSCQDKIENQVLNGSNKITTSATKQLWSFIDQATLQTNTNHGRPNNINTKGKETRLHKS